MNNRFYRNEIAWERFNFVFQERNSCSTVFPDDSAELAKPTAGGGGGGGGGGSLLEKVEVEVEVAEEMECVLCPGYCSMFNAIH